jgi:hypothetical protein
VTIAIDVDPWVRIDGSRPAGKPPRRMDHKIAPGQASRGGQATKKARSFERIIPRIEFDDYAAIAAFTPADVAHCRRLGLSESTFAPGRLAEGVRIFVR